VRRAAPCHRPSAAATSRLPRRPASRPSSLPKGQNRAAAQASRAAAAAPESQAAARVEPVRAAAPAARRRRRSRHQRGPNETSSAVSRLVRCRLAQVRGCVLSSLPLRPPGRPGDVGCPAQRSRRNSCHMVLLSRASVDYMSCRRCRPQDANVRALSRRIGHRHPCRGRLLAPLPVCRPREPDRRVPRRRAYPRRVFL
jgi:hypothetical protein